MAHAIRSVAVNAGCAAGLVDVTPNNDADLPGGKCRGLLVTVAGTLAVVCSDDSAPTAFPVVVGQVVPVSIKRVKATGTTATVKALYGAGF